jgi:hypothetical protein
MININARWRISAAAFVAAASLAGCNSGSGGIGPPSTVAPPPPTPPAQTADFSVFAEKAFAANANSTPVSLDGVTFTFDVNNDPGAFDTLIGSGTFQ